MSNNWKKAKLTDDEYNRKPLTSAMLFGTRLSPKIKQRAYIKSQRVDPNVIPDKIAGHAYRFNTDGHNIKLGEAVASWSTLFGSRTYIIPELGYMAIKGTCKNCDVCEDSCYVAHSYRNPSPIWSHARNTWGLRNEPGKVFADLDKQLYGMGQPFIRLNQSGDIETEDEFYGWIMLAENHPEKNFYIYTKRYDIVTPVLLAGAVPKNFVILYSIWHDVGVAEYNVVKHLPNVKCFIYDDGVDLKIKPDGRCMAYNGHNLNHKITCGKCKKCVVAGGTKNIVCSAH